MRPVAIFRHLAIEGPGLLADFLDRQGVPWRLVAIDAGEAVPDSVAEFSGLVFMGGPMSVNDDLPWISRELALIRAAVAADVPVLGHCLGAQLMAKALGGEVTLNPVKEIGWGEVRVADDPTARAWFGEVGAFTAFHWHGETFSIPPAAIRVLGNDACHNQGFVLGKHLGLQCHVEMTAPMVAEWCRYGAGEIAAAASPAVQAPEVILAATATWLPAMSTVAEGLYGHWLRGLAKT